jgi:undecaprenyl pyrophosphate phosphatase UppP
MDNEDRISATEPEIQDYISYKSRTIMAGIQHFDARIFKSRFIEKDSGKMKSIGNRGGYLFSVFSISKKLITTKKRFSMNIPRKYQLMIVIGIAFLFILYGILGLLFKFKVDKNIESQVSVTLMLIAAFIVFSGRKKANAGNKEEPQKDELQEPVEDQRDNDKKNERL